MDQSKVNFARLVMASGGAIFTASLSNIFIPVSYDHKEAFVAAAAAGAGILVDQLIIKPRIKAYE